MPKNKKDVEEELEGVREKAQRLEGDIGEEEAIDLLEEAVEEVERFGDKLEENDS